MTEQWREWPVANISELPPRGSAGFLVGGGEWPFRGFVVRQDDAVFAYANVCPHRRHALDLVDGDFLVQEGTMIRCASHGALFVPDTGICVLGPCVGQGLLQLECRVEGGQVFVRAPDSLRDIDVAGQQ